MSGLADLDLLLQETWAADAPGLPILFLETSINGKLLVTIMDHWNSEAAAQTRYVCTWASTIKEPRGLQSIYGLPGVGFVDGQLRPGNVLAMPRTASRSRGRFDRFDRPSLFLAKVDFGNRKKKGGVFARLDSHCWTVNTTSIVPPRSLQAGQRAVQLYNVRRVHWHALRLALRSLLGALPHALYVTQAPCWQ